MTDNNPPDDDPFAEFEDWLVDGPAGKWPRSWRVNQRLSKAQEAIVARNADLLLNKPKGWAAKARRFEEALEELSNDEAITIKRSLYEIHFDWFSFPGGLKDFSYTHFPCAVSFVLASFGDGPLSFVGAHFYGGAG